MSLTKAKWVITTIQSLRNKVTGQSTVLKQLFDKASLDIETYINNTLTTEIETQFATKEEVQGIVIGQILDGSITDVKLSNTTGQVKDMITKLTPSLCGYQYITTDGQAVGDISIEASAIPLTKFNICYLSVGGYNKAKGDSASTLGVLAMALETQSSVGNLNLLFKGHVRNDSWTFTKGQILYVSPSTAGDITNIKPTTGQFAQIIGIAKLSNIIWFCPDILAIEVK